MEVPLKVLIIEDDPLLGKTLADILKHQGYVPLVTRTAA
jgi:DNA-binding response OmpR family regulator